MDLLRKRLAGLGIQPDASRVAGVAPAPFDPPTIGPRRDGLPYAPERAPEGIELDFGDGRKGRVNLEMLEGVASLSSAPARGAAAAAKAALPRLSALHNTTAEKLGKSLDLGGFPVPSVAVVPEHIPFTDFGDITLVGKQSLGDPSTSRVYSADAYTTRVPKQVFPKLTKKQFFDVYGSRSGNREGWESNAESIWNKMQGNEFLAKQMRELVQEPQVKVGRKMRDWNLDNVAEAMSSKGRLTEGKQYFSHFDPGPIRAGNARIFRELEPMRKAAAERVRLDADEYDESAEQLRVAMSQLASRVDIPESRSPFEAFDAIMRAAAGRGTPAGNLAREGLEFFVPPGIPKDAPNPGLTRSLSEFETALNRFRNAPVKYFEAKPQRGVRFDEFAGAVVPEGTDAALIERLRNAGLQVEPYKVYADSPLDLKREPAVERLRRLLNEQGGNTLFSLGALGAGLGAANTSNQSTR